VIESGEIPLILVKSAQVWIKKNQLAAKNPCHQWLLLSSDGNYASSAPGSEVTLAPGAHFNWGKKQAWAPTVVRLWDASQVDEHGVPCGAAPTVLYLVYSYRDIRQGADNCP
jgi:hypothetical protein